MYEKAINLMTKAIDDLAEAIWSMTQALAEAIQAIYEFVYRAYICYWGKITLFTNVTKFKTWRGRFGCMRINLNSIVRYRIFWWKYNINKLRRFFNMIRPKTELAIEKTKLRILLIKMFLLDVKLLWAHYRLAKASGGESEFDLVKDSGVDSLNAYFNLRRFGFRISIGDLYGYRDIHGRGDTKKSSNLRIFRFWWKDKAIENFPDIDQIGVDFYTLIDGESNPLE